MHGRWKGIDMAVSLRFTGNRDRIATLDKELGRVGLDVLPIWQFPSPVYSFLQNECPRKSGGMRLMGFFNSGFGHYRAWKTCRELGMEHCLIVEDDIRFPKDLARLDAGLATLPADYDIALLDKIRCANTADEYVASFLRSDEARVCDGWVRRWGECGPRSFAAYMLSQKGMDALIKRFESSVSHTPRYPLRVVDAFISHNWLHSDANIYLAHPNLAIQDVSGNLRCNSDVHNGPDNNLARFYRAIGVNPEDYAI